VLCGGAPGKRMALPNSKIMIHQGSAGFRGTPTDIEIHAQEIISMRQRMAEIIAEHSKRPLESVLKDIDRDHFMSPDEAVQYGIVDEIVSPRAVDGRITR
jgi:ATP-dependent Clp protease, protease subunit